MQPDIASATSELVGQIQGRARELGLTWQMVKATVNTVSTSGTDVTATLDGDTVPITVISMVAEVLTAGDRVWVITVPPGGNYVAGLVTPVTPPTALYSARQTLTGSAASVTFSSIPTALRRIRVSYTARADNAVQVQTMRMRINGVATANYFVEYLQGNNVTAAAVAQAGVNDGNIGTCTGSLAAAGIYASGQVEIQNWDNAGSINMVPWTFVSQGLGVGAANFFAQSGGGLYNLAGPYTSLTFMSLAGNLVAGTDIQLEGWPTS